MIILKVSTPYSGFRVEKHERNVRMCENPDEGRYPTPELKDWENGRLIGDPTGTQTHGPAPREVSVWNGTGMERVAVGCDGIKGE